MFFEQVKRQLCSGRRLFGEKWGEEALNRLFSKVIDESANSSTCRGCRYDCGCGREELNDCLEQTRGSSNFSSSSSYSLIRRRVSHQEAAPICSVHRVIQAVAIGIAAPGQPKRVALDISAGERVVVAKVVVKQPCLLIEILPGE